VETDAGANAPLYPYKELTYVEKLQNKTTGSAQVPVPVEVLI